MIVHNIKGKKQNKMFCYKEQMAAFLVILFLHCFTSVCSKILNVHLREGDWLLLWFLIFVVLCPPLQYFFKMNISVHPLPLPLFPNSQL